MEEGLYFPEYPDYKDVAKALFPGFDIEEERFGSYQGDLIMVLTRPGEEAFKFGIMGFGSCTGCDMLEGGVADQGPEWPATRFRVDKETAAYVHGAFRDFKDMADFRGHVAATEAGKRVGEWWFYEDGMEDWLAEFMDRTHASQTDAKEET